MSNAYLSGITRQYIILPRVAPAATVAVAIQTARGFAITQGAAFRHDGLNADGRVFFDLASVTKPFVACSVARLARKGLLTFDLPLQELLPEARGSETGKLPLELLLAHRAGLQAHRTLFAPLLARLPFDPAAALSEIIQGRRPECVGPVPVAGYPPIYSDLGFALVGLALERLVGQALDEIVRSEVCAPLGIQKDIGSSRSLRREQVNFAERCMPTETVPFRGGQILGVVHDENAWALSGHGMSGHAGLFGTAEGVARFGAALLDAWSGRSTDWLDRATLTPLLAERPGGTLRAGFDGKSADQSSAGTMASLRSFGHLGFTGTSLWCDPDADRAMVLLTNRVCPTRQNPAIQPARRAVNDALFAFQS